MAELLAFIIMLALYLAPIGVARARQHPDLIKIAAVNVLLGWTGAGWVACLAWAAWKSPKDSSSSAPKPAGEGERLASSSRVEAGLSGGTHVVHGLLALFTAGAWAVVWLTHWAVRRFGIRRVGIGVGVAVVGLVGLGVVGQVHWNSLSPEERARITAERKLAAAQREAEAEQQRVEREAERARRQEERDEARRLAAIDQEKRDRERRCKGDGDMALIMSQDFVKKRLKAPSTAKFPYMSSEGVRVRPADECSYQVVAYVDSQNSFGAMLRTPYIAYLSPKPDGKTWVLDSLLIDP